MQRYEQYTATTVFVTPLYLITIVLGSFGNALVIYSYVKDKGIQRSFYFLLANFAVADFLISAVFTPLLFAYRVHERAEFIGYTPLCEISLFTSMCCISLVYFIFPLMALHRKHVLSRSQHARLSMPQVCFAMSFFWCLSILSGVMMVVLARREFTDSGPAFLNMYRCLLINQSLDFYAQVFLGYSMTLTGLSTAITAVIYSQIYLSLPGNKSSEERQITKTCLWLVLLHTACWTPFSVLQVLAVFGTYTELHFNLHGMFSAIGVIGSAVAPCLYFAGIPYYRASVHYLFHGRIFQHQKRK
ncbi:somatostatin receptor type 1-like [Montipora capricornis]|uniref:somatostatin receptor type 1-like n=1 Tax=Montipora capricornis TaxID=246305 RepID=UPI0035F17E67